MGIGSKIKKAARSFDKKASKIYRNSTVMTALGAGVGALFGGPAGASLGMGLGSALGAGVEKKVSEPSIDTGNDIPIAPLAPVDLNNTPDLGAGSVNDIGKGFFPGMASAGSLDYGTGSTIEEQRKKRWGL